VVGHRKPTVDCDAEISYCRQWVDAGIQQLNVSCSDLVQLLLGPEPYLLWIQPQSVALHPLLNSCHTNLKAVDCVVRVSRQRVDIQLNVVGVEVSRRTVWHYDVEQLGRVEKEQQWPKYRALWYTPQQNDQRRQIPGVRHTLRTFSQEWPNPAVVAAAAVVVILSPHAITSVWLSFCLFVQLRAESYTWINMKFFYER